MDVETESTVGRNIFVVSDTHFGHANILRFTDSTTGELIRPGFASLEEMDEHMIQQWNSVVQDKDIVYHLGDVYMNDGHRVLPRLQGRKRLILGNHDNGKSLYLQAHFQKIMMWRMWPELNCVLTHVPIHESGMYKVHYNLHGHIHQNPSPTERHINCSVEVQSYTPRSVEEIIAQLPA
jgi:calcineurin-like phosphoesterase family protein